MREDFKTASEILSFKLDFTPKVSVSPPSCHVLLTTLRSLSAGEASGREGEKNPTEEAGGGPWIFFPSQTAPDPERGLV